VVGTRGEKKRNKLDIATIWEEIRKRPGKRGGNQQDEDIYSSGEV